MNKKTIKMNLQKDLNDKYVVKVQDSTQNNGKPSITEPFKDKDSAKSFIFTQKNIFEKKGFEVTYNFKQK